LIGPVLPGEKPIKQPKLPAGTYPGWSGTTVYQEGDRVIFEDRPFVAKWWNQGESPAKSASNPDSSPWAPISLKEIEEILNKKSGK
jgi:chitinase